MHLDFFKVYTHSAFDNVADVETIIKGLQPIGFGFLSPRFE